MKCPDGKKLSWGEKCDLQDDCPVTKSSYSAISFNCSAPSNGHCPQGKYFSKVCHVNFSNDNAAKNKMNTSEFADQYCSKGKGKPCKLSHGPFYHQCFEKL